MLATEGVRSFTRFEAMASGAKTYVSTRPCLKGHESPVVRITANGSCRECARALSRQMWRDGRAQKPVNRAAHLKKWNGSSRGKTAKRRWREKDPVRAFVVGSVGAARARSITLGLPFDLTNEYVRSIVPEKCPVLGVALTFLNGGWHGASLDKIIPSRGYVKGNVAVISRRANMIKSDASAEEVEAVARWMRSLECRTKD